MLASEKKYQVDDSMFWNCFYESLDEDLKLDIPSQFAAFCANEFKNLGIQKIIEFGAGNGRDSVFFAKHGFDVLATDMSSSALDILNNKSSVIRNLTARYCDVREAASASDYSSYFADQRCAYYARFFLHALPTCDISDFFIFLGQVLKSKDFLAVEYRTAFDSNRVKETSTHFRNYLSPEKINRLAVAAGLVCEYEVQGLGLAKWKSDDAHVARQLFRKI